MAHQQRSKRLEKLVEDYCHLQSSVVLIEMMMMTNMTKHVSNLNLRSGEDEPIFC